MFPVAHAICQFHHWASTHNRACIRDWRLCNCHHVLKNSRVKCEDAPIDLVLGGLDFKDDIPIIEPRTAASHLGSYFRIFQQCSLRLGCRSSGIVHHVVDKTAETVIMRGRKIAESVHARLPYSTYCCHNLDTHPHLPTNIIIPEHPILCSFSSYRYLQAVCISYPSSLSYLAFSAFFPDLRGYRSTMPTLLSRAATRIMGQNSTPAFKVLAAGPPFTVEAVTV